ncbi:phosphatase PAP2 family protein [Candidatus Bipolaricaulota bacterium]|nr:phosphatase PAP2 family protein [Candidatus Bipolaricaulota bacterium]
MAFVKRFDRWIDAITVWDERTLCAISESPRLRKIDWLFRAATYLGDGYVWAALALGLILFGSSLDRDYVLVALSITVINITIFRMFKMAFTRPRPQLLTPDERAWKIDTYSFPSGHTTIAYGVAWAISSVYPSLAVGLATYSGAALIGLSRVYVNEHYPLDVIGGAILGTTISSHLLPIFLQFVL